MSEPKIQGLEKLLQKYVGAEKTVKETNITRLTKPGENYGSIMLKVEAKLSGVNGEEEILHAVAKCLPESETLRKIFRVDTSVMAETKFYTDIVPLLQEFQREHGVTDVLECFPRFYGGRLNLQEEGDQIDDHAVLILENLKVSGFQNINRFIGFNLEEANFILKDVATFHAACLALRLKKPEVFDERIRKYFAVKENRSGPSIGTILTDMLEGYESVKPYLGKLKQLVDKFTGGRDVADITPGELFATVAHKDLWLNNTMQKFEDGKLVDNKFVDFQNYTYDSVVRDLLFFLVTSCRFEVLKDNMDNLIKHYYRHFVLTLKNLDCDTSAYTLEALYAEIEKYAEAELIHCIGFTTFVVFGKELEESDGMPKLQLTKDEVSEEVKNRAVCIIEYFVKQGWLVQ